jgi:hypothetical protein
VTDGVASRCFGTAAGRLRRARHPRERRSQTVQPRVSARRRDRAGLSRSRGWRVEPASQAATLRCDGRAGRARHAVRGSGDRTPVVCGLRPESGRGAASRSDQRNDPPGVWKPRFGAGERPARIGAQPEGAAVTASGPERTSVREGRAQRSRGTGTGGVLAGKRSVFRHRARTGRGPCQPPTAFEQHEPAARSFGSGPAARRLDPAGERRTEATRATPVAGAAEVRLQTGRGEKAPAKGTSGFGHRGPAPRARRRGRSGEPGRWGATVRHPEGVQTRTAGASPYRVAGSGDVVGKVSGERQEGSDRRETERLLERRKL